MTSVFGFLLRCAEPTRKQLDDASRCLKLAMFAMDHQGVDPADYCFREDAGTMDILIGVLQDEAEFPYCGVMRMPDALPRLGLTALDDLRRKVPQLADATPHMFVHAAKD
jgi:hypothetical protein